MRLLLDECAGDRNLRDALIAHGHRMGHDVLRSVNALGGGADDPAVLAFACGDNRVVVTDCSFSRVCLRASINYAIEAVYWCAIAKRRRRSIGDFLTRSDGTGAAGR
jgi:predicted nuclease of predicted toxin-antitoxin system